jgi:hypothetical protein
MFGSMSVCVRPPALVLATRQHISDHRCKGPLSMTPYVCVRRMLVVAVYSRAHQQCARPPPPSPVPCSVPLQASEVVRRKSPSPSPAAARSPRGAGSGPAPSQPRFMMVDIVPYTDNVEPIRAFLLPCVRTHARCCYTLARPCAPPPLPPLLSAHVFFVDE